MDNPPFRKQIQEISFNLLLDIFVLTILQRTVKFAAIPELWNTLIDNCQKSFFPHADVAVDEQLFFFTSIFDQAARKALRIRTDLPT